MNVLQANRLQQVVSNKEQALHQAQHAQQETDQQRKQLQRQLQSLQESQEQLQGQLEEALQRRASSEKAVEDLKSQVPHDTLTHTFIPVLTHSNLYEIVENVTA